MAEIIDISGIKFDEEPQILKPQLQNPDGSVSTERTIGIEKDGKFFNISTIIDGVQRTPEEAILMFQEGNNPAVGEFDTQEEADGAAIIRSNDIGRQISETNNVIDVSDITFDEGHEQIFYLEDVDKTVSVPANLDIDQANEKIQTEVYGKDKRGFWGGVGMFAFNAAKGSASLISMLPQVPGVAIQEVGEIGILKLEERSLDLTERIIAQRERDAQMKADDPNLNYFQETVENYRLFRQRESITFLKFALVDTQRDLAEARAMDSAGRAIIRSNVEFIMKHKIIPDEGGANRFAFDLGNVASSIIISVGASLALKTNLITPLLFGGIAKSQLFLEAEEKGVPIERRKLLSDRGFILEAGFEFIGLEIFTKWLRGSKVFTRTALRTGTEGLQEVFQQGSEEFIRKAEGLSNDDWNTIILRIAYAGALGMIGGLGPASLLTFAESKGIVGDLRKAGFNDAEIESIAVGIYTNQRDIVKAEVESLLQREAQKQFDEVQPEVVATVENLEAIEEDEDVDIFMLKEEGLPEIPVFSGVEEADDFGRQNADTLTLKALELVQVRLEESIVRLEKEGGRQPTINAIRSGHLQNVRLAIQAIEKIQLEQKTVTSAREQAQKVQFQQQELFPFEQGVLLAGRDEKQQKEDIKEISKATGESAEEVRQIIQEIQQEGITEVSELSANQKLVVDEIVKITGNPIQQVLGISEEIDAFPSEVAEEEDIEPTEPKRKANLREVAIELRGLIELASEPDEVADRTKSLIKSIKGNLKRGTGETQEEGLIPVSLFNKEGRGSTLDDFAGEHSDELGALGFEGSADGLREFIRVNINEKGQAITTGVRSRQLGSVTDAGGPQAAIKLLDKLLRNRILTDTQQAKVDKMITEFAEQRGIEPVTVLGGLGSVISAQRDPQGFLVKEGFEVQKGFSNNEGVPLVSQRKNTETGENMVLDEKTGRFIVLPEGQEGFASTVFNNITDGTMKINLEGKVDMLNVRDFIQPDETFSGTNMNILKSLDEMTELVKDVLDDNNLGTDQVDIVRIFPRGDRFRFGQPEENADIDLEVIYTGELAEQELVDLLEEEEVQMGNLNVDWTVDNVPKFESTGDKPTPTSVENQPADIPLLKKEEFPTDLAGGLSDDLSIRFDDGKPWSVALTNKRKGLKNDVNNVIEKLKELTGVDWRVDDISNFVYHAVNIPKSKLKGKGSEDQIEKKMEVTEDTLTTADAEQRFGGEALNRDMMWQPLEQFFKEVGIPEDQLSGFMFMGSYSHEREDGKSILINQFKHGISRTSVSLGDDGRAYRYNGGGPNVPPKGLTKNAERRWRELNKEVSDTMGDFSEKANKFRTVRMNQMRDIEKSAPQWIAITNQEANVIIENIFKGVEEMGFTRTTPYNDEFRQKKAIELKKAGFETFTFNAGDTVKENEKKMDALKKEVSKDAKPEDKEVVEDLVEDVVQGNDGVNNPPPTPPVPPSGKQPEGEPQPESKIPFEEFVKNRKGQPITERAIDFGTDILESLVLQSENFLGVLSTRMKNISPVLGRRLRNFDFKMLAAIRTDTRAIIPYLKGMSRMSKQNRRDLDLALKNGDKVTIDRINTATGLTEEYQRVVEMLNGIYERATNAGLSVNYLEDFWPRVVRNPKKLIDFMKGTSEWSQIAEAIQRLETENGIAATEEEQAYLINSLLRGFETSQIKLGRPNALKEREIDFVTSDMNKFYAKSDASIISYLTTVNEAIEANKFFGKGTKTDKFVNIDDSVGFFVLKEIQQGNINASDEAVLTDLLKARFNRGRMSLGIGIIKDISYITILGNPINALTQLGDLAFGLDKAGIYRTGKAFFNAVIGRSKITKETIGVDRVAAEFTTGSRASERAVRAVFKLSGLSWLDSIGKEATINAVIDLYRSQAKNPSKDFMVMLNEVMGEEANQVIEDLKSGAITENVKFLAFNELADVQPITLSEVPVNYLRAKNGKIFYALKTYQIKLLDVYRNKVFAQMRTNPIKGLRNLLRLTFSLVLVNASADFLKDLLMRRPLDSMSDRVAENIAKIMGFNRYTVYKVQTEGPVSTLAEQILPPFQVFDNIYKDAAKAVQIGSTLTVDELDDFLIKTRSVQNIPIGGKLFYWWFGRGVELAEKEQTKQDNKNKETMFLKSLPKEQRKAIIRIRKKAKQKLLKDKFLGVK